MPYYDNALFIDCLGCRRSIELTLEDNLNDFDF